ncbi:hypothetical protein VZT92_000201 [Zoarces viviparus]|uniref:Uncharacterized protein n=1 Tax=Zoarces viviparus TaxID=48416 RepID=A0AAW1G4S4_ZOAVI
MARPSLPAAMAPFRGCPAGCLRVACETLLSPSAQKGRMNNGPRQALALNNPSLCFALCLTFHRLQKETTSYSRKTRIPLSIQYRPSAAICSNTNLFSPIPSVLLLSVFPSVSLCLNPPRLPFLRQNTLNQGEGERPHISVGSQDPV